MSTINVSGAFTSPNFLDGVYQWTNFTNPVPTQNTVAPYPLTVNPTVNSGVVPGFGGDYRLLHSSICCNFNTNSGWQSRTNAKFSCGVTLISPSYVIGAWHCKPSRMWFQQADGTEIYRDAVSSTLISGSEDLAIIKLNAPINSIAPAIIPKNPSVFMSGFSARLGFVQEIGGRYTTMLPDSSYVAWGTGVTKLRIRKDLPPGTTPAASGGLLQGGDSGHPFVIVVKTIPLLLGVLYQSSPIPAKLTPGAYTTSYGYLPNISKFILPISGILAADGESLTLANVTIT